MSLPIFLTTAANVVQIVTIITTILLIIGVDNTTIISNSCQLINDTVCYYYLMNFC